jgi:hypothetical protein
MSSIGIMFILLLILYLLYSNFSVGPPISTAGQQDNLPKIPSVKITSPKSGQLVFASITNTSNPTNGTSNNSTLLVSGTATDNADSPCEVSVLLNDVRPYQPATPRGTSGIDDYSNWQFSLTPDYAPIKQGANKITAKLECLKSPVNLTKWYSVRVIGGTQEQVLLQEQQFQKQKLEEERQKQLALREIQLKEQREQLMIERAKANAAKINQTEMFVKIESPEKNQYVPIGPITVSGTSSDNSTTDCQVYVDWNDLKPPQKARAAVLLTNNNNTNLGDGQSGNNYSNWTYTFTKEYHEITNGTNELTAKLECLAYPSNYTKFFSVNVTGVPQEQILRQQQEEQLRQQLMIERAKANAAKINQTEMFVKIESHKPGQHVLRDSNLTISGTSSDNATTDCDVSVVLNSKTPYQQALPINDSGTNNYSNWTFTLTPRYGTPKEGENEMTSRISCLAYPSNYTKFSSINVTGVPQEGLSLQQQENSLPQPQQQQQQRQQQQTILQQGESQLISVSQIPKGPDISVNLSARNDSERGATTKNKELASIV